MLKFIQQFKLKQQKKSIRKVVFFSLISSMICSSIVFLLTPKKGSETRKDISKNLKTIKNESNSLIDSIRQKIRNFWEGSTEIKEKYFDKNFDKMTQKVGEKATELKDNFDNVKEEVIKDKKIKPEKPE